MATPRPENYSLTEASALYVKELIYTRQEANIRAYNANLQAERGYDYGKFSTKDHTFVEGGTNKNDLLWSLCCRACPQDCELGALILKGWSLQGHLRVVEQGSGGHLGRL